MGWRPWCALHRGRFARLEMTVYEQGEELKVFATEGAARAWNAEPESRRTSDAPRVAICSWLPLAPRSRSNKACSITQSEHRTVRPMADKGWQRKFEDPIPLPDGQNLFTLRDAADYIMKLPKKESDLPEWQTAIEVLMLVSRSGPTMMARIGVMKALNRHVERVFDPGRKETRWGKRKLKRDQ